MRLVLFVALIAVWAVSVAAAGDSTKQIADIIAGLLILASPLVLKFVRARWPKVDGRVFAIGTWIVAALVVAVALTISGEWRSIDLNNAASFGYWSTFLYGVQQLEYNLLKPQLEVAR